ncbi:hypothetical protein ACEZCY_01055 [Streptacidiphilus sp. N1-12]|uniref:Uncharacterized protein n=2 Tax=Streptacidiphilus alkalitolerans TaxID=3342712 RepID=A0ABV6W6Z0_9ACTN
MPWTVLAAVSFSTAGLLVLAGCALLVHRQVLALSRQLDAGARRIAGAARGLEQAGSPVARRAGELAPGRILPFTEDGSGSA